MIDDELGLSVHAEINVLLAKVAVAEQIALFFAADKAEQLIDLDKLERMIADALI